jgi:Ca2+-binding EF-hand superfamily protein
LIISIGFITEEELFVVMNKFRKVSKDDVKKMVKAVDTDSNGKISINGMLTKKKKRFNLS